MKKRKKSAVLILIAALLFSLPLPAMAQDGGEADRAAETGGPAASAVEADTVAGDIEGAVVGIEKCQSGGYYVLATKNQSQESDILESDGLYLYRYDESLDRILDEYSVGTGGSYPGDYTASTGETYPIYVDTPDWVYTADDYGNAAFSQDSEGNLYIAYKSVDYRQLRALSEICQYKDTLYPECICDICDVTAEGHRGICWSYEDSGRVEDCPVCNAWHECYDSGLGTATTVCLTVEKLNNSLEKTDEYSISYTLEEANDSITAAALTPYSLAVDSDGSVIVAGMSDKDFLKDRGPVLSYDHFRYEGTPESANQTSQHARGFLLRLDPELAEIEACTYLGGMNVYNAYVGGDSFVTSLALSDGILYAAGGEYSGLIPTTEGVLQEEHAEQTRNMRTRDAFIAKLDPETLQVTNATYYGGDSTDYISKILVRDGCIYAAGMSMSTDLRTSADAYQKTISATGTQPYFDSFVLRLSDSLRYDSQFAASYLGGNAREDLFDMDVSETGEIAVTGKTYGSGGYPTTDGGTEGSYYISVLNGDCSNLRASSLVKDGTGRIVRFAKDETLITAGMAVESGKYQAYVTKMDTSLTHGGIMSVRYLQPVYGQAVYLGEGDLLSIIVTFDNPVAVAGQPRIKLNLKNAGGENCYAVYTEPTDEQKESDLYYGTGNGQKKILFTYEIQKGDTTGGAVLDCAGSDALELNGGTIMPRTGGSGNFSLDLPMNALGLSSSNVYVGVSPEDPDEDTAYDVEITDADGLKAAEGSVTNDLLVQEDRDSASVKLHVTPQDTETVSGEVTVLWTQMRGNRMISYGTSAASAAAQSELSLELESLEAGDVIKIFVLREPLDEQKGSMAQILNASGSAETAGIAGADAAGTATDKDRG